MRSELTSQRSESGNGGSASIAIAWPLRAG
jgi:hypothetical protein